MLHLAANVPGRRKPRHPVLERVRPRLAGQVPGRKMACGAPQPCILTGVVLAGGLGVVLLQRLNQDRHYRRLLADGDAALAPASPTWPSRAFSGALALRPDSMVAHFRRGEAYAAQGQDDARRARPAGSPAARARRAGTARGPRPPATIARATPPRPPTGTAQAADRLKDADPALLYSLALARYRAGRSRPPRTSRSAARSRATIRWPRRTTCWVWSLRDAQQPDARRRRARTGRAARPALLAAREELADLYRDQGRAADETAQLEALAALDQQLDRQLALAMAELRASDYAAALETLDDADAAASRRLACGLAIGRIYLARAERRPIARPSRCALAALERALGGTARRSEGLALFGRALYLRATSRAPSGCCRRPWPPRRSIPRRSGSWPTRPSGWRIPTSPVTRSCSTSMRSRATRRRPTCRRRVRGASACSR